MEAQLPSLANYLVILPELALLVLVMIIVIYNGVVKDAGRRKVGLLTVWGSAVILLMSIGLVIFDDVLLPGASSLMHPDRLYWGGMIVHDPITITFRLMFIAALLLTALLSLDTKALQKGEYFALLVTATFGFSLMAASADFIMLLVALETASISLYLLAGLATEDSRSAEAGMKYFIYGAFASALLMYGMSLMYGAFQETSFFKIGLTISSGGIPAGLNGLVLVSAILIVVGFGFKISAVPFHFWAPDVYHGAPTPVTGFLSTASKAAGFAVFFRVFAIGTFGRAVANQTITPWWVLLLVIAILTMSLGNMMALFQTNIKRMLAYSSVAQAGYILLGLIALQADGSGGVAGAGAAMYYLIMYIITNIAAFGVITLVSNYTKSDEMRDFYGLGKRSPYLAVVMLFALLSLAGIPPTAGFFGKFFLFKAVVDAGLWVFALIGILNAFVALYYYLNVIKFMYMFDSETGDSPIPVSRAAKLALVVSVLGIVYMGVFANSAFEWTQAAARYFYPFAQ